MVKTLRQTAEQRREAVLDAAKIEFARHGLHGASTDAIARRAGISQPYLFRLFGTKKELFLALNEACFAETLQVFREAASGKSGDEALRAIGDAYRGLIESDRTMLQGQLQSYAASVEDVEVRESTARGLRAARRLRRDGLGRRPPDDLRVLRHRHAVERPRCDAVLDRRRPARVLGRAPGGRLQGNGVTVSFFAASYE